MSPNAIEPVRSYRHGSTLVLAIDRPEAGNSIDLATAEAFDRLLDRHAGDTTLRSLVVTGNGGRFFCTGGDVKRYRDFTDADGLNKTFDTIRSLLVRLESYELPVIAAIDGYAIGGGVELALACDLRIAGPTAQFALPQIRMGLVPGWDGVERLVRTVGRSAALQLLLGGDRHPARQAQAIGLVDVVPENGTALDAALAFGVALDDKSRASILEIKRLVHACYSRPGDVSP